MEKEQIHSRKESLLLPNQTVKLRNYHTFWSEERWSPSIIQIVMRRFPQDSLGLRGGGGSRRRCQPLARDKITGQQRLFQPPFLFVIRIRELVYPGLWIRYWFGLQDFLEGQEMSSHGSRRKTWICCIYKLPPSSIPLHHPPPSPGGGDGQRRLLLLLLHC